MGSSYMQVLVLYNPPNTRWTEVININLRSSWSLPLDCISRYLGNRVMLSSSQGLLAINLVAKLSSHSGYALKI